MQLQVTDRILTAHLGSYCTAVSLCSKPCRASFCNNELVVSILCCKLTIQYSPDQVGLGIGTHITHLETEKHVMYKVSDDSVSSQIPGEALSICTHNGPTSHR